MKYSPQSKQINQQNLKLLIDSKRHKKLFCWHKWIYWTHGVATKQHRVCEKCFKKQQNSDVLSKYSGSWINSNF